MEYNKVKWIYPYIFHYTNYNVAEHKYLSSGVKWKKLFKKKAEWIIHALNYGNIQWQKRALMSYKMDTKKGEKEGENGFNVLREKRMLLKWEQRISLPVNWRLYSIAFWKSKCLMKFVEQSILYSIR